MSDRLPWKYSQALGGEYLYLTGRDELYFRDGRRMPRPSTISRASLANAAFDGDPTMFYQSREPPLYSTSTDPAHSGPQTIPRFQPGMSTSPPGSVGTSPDDLINRFGSLNVGSGPSTGPAGPRVQFASNMSMQTAPPRSGMIAARVVTATRQSGNRVTEIMSSEVTGPVGETERLFPEYKTRSKKFFFVGKVFSMLWSEPAGKASNHTQITSYEEGISIGPYHEKIYSKIRRFVVIRAVAGNDYCNALPISTYGGKGVGKHGVNKSEHAIIYTGSSSPRPMPQEQAGRGEMPMRSTTIRVDPDSLEDKLDPRSRLNFGHPHTIQYNVKARSCGKVPESELVNMLQIFASVFGMPPTSGLRYRIAGGGGGDDDGDYDDDENDNGEDDEGDGDEYDDDDDDDEDIDDANVQQLRNAMIALMRNGASIQDVLTTTLRSLVGRGLDRNAAQTLIKKACPSTAPRSAQATGSSSAGPSRSAQGPSSGISRGSNAGLPPSYRGTGVPPQGRGSGSSR